MNPKKGLYAEKLSPAEHERGAGKLISEVKEGAQSAQAKGSATKAQR